MALQAGWLQRGPVFTKVTNNTMSDQTTNPTLKSPSEQPTIAETDRKWTSVYRSKGYGRETVKQKSTNRKLEKNKDLVQNRYVDKKKVIRTILESGKSKEEIVDLLADLIKPEGIEVVSKTNADFQAAATVEVSPLPKDEVRYGERKTHPEFSENYAHMNPVEFFEELWAKKWKANGAWTITQRQVNLFDDTLLSNVRAHCRRNGPDAATILPPADVTRRPQSRPEDFAEGTADFKLAKIKQSQRDSMARRRSANKEFH
jgi:hypothetical protein